jgi:hypothetical protein
MEISSNSPENILFTDVTENILGKPRSAQNKNHRL